MSTQPKGFFLESRAKVQHWVLSERWWRLSRFAHYYFQTMEQDCFVVSCRGWIGFDKLPGNCTLGILLLKILTSLVLVAVYALCRPLTEQSSMTGTSSVGVFEEVNTYLVSVLLLAHVKANLQLLDMGWTHCSSWKHDQGYSWAHRIWCICRTWTICTSVCVVYPLYYIISIKCGRKWKHSFTFMYHVEPVVETYHYPCIPFFIDSWENSKAVFRLLNM